jgi:hypothetical protein
MANTNPSRATVRRALLQRKKVPDALASVANVCSTGNGCTEVKNDPIASAALAQLIQVSATAQDRLAKYLAAVQAVRATSKDLRTGFATVRTTLTTYEAAVNAIAHGDAGIINRAGLLARDDHTSAAALGKVSVLHSKLGKHDAEAIISWPAAPGATSYAIEVNVTPQNPSGTWTALQSGSSRRRVVKAPTPGAELLVRVAAIGSDGTQSEWSDTLLATTTR